jgi:hypothetical protein
MDTQAETAAVALALDQKKLEDAVNGQTAT